MDHMQFMMVKTADQPEELCGHALMITCPPESHVVNHPEVKYPHKAPDLQMPDLLKLLDLSNRLPLDGEITPIMAWSQVLRHERFAEFTKEDFAVMQEDLRAKIRCYG